MATRTPLLGQQTEGTTNQNINWQHLRTNATCPAEFHESLLGSTIDDARTSLDMLGVQQGTAPDINYHPTWVPSELVAGMGGEVFFDVDD